MNIPSILIADDDPDIVRLLRTVLEPLGAQIRETYDATSALAMIQRSPPSLVIFDIAMPGGNGLSACEMLKTDKSMAHVPVIILSWRSDDATLNRCKEMGAHFVCKGPEALSEVKRLVDNLLGTNQVARVA
jgi:two-component system, sensor histidine kinase and response regulator